MNLHEELFNRNNIEEYIRELKKKGFTNEDIRLFARTLKTVSPLYSWSVPRQIVLPTGREVFTFSEADTLILKYINKLLYKYEPFQEVPNVFSYKSALGINDATRFVMNNLNKGKFNYITIDITDYFTTISHDVLMSALNTVVTDDVGRGLLSKLYRSNMYYCKEYIVHREDLGVLPCNDLSVYVTNFILNNIDITLAKSVSCYCRFDGKILLVDENVERLNSSLEYIKECINRFGLAYDPNIVQRGYDVRSVPYLDLNISSKSITACEKALNNLKIDVKELCERLRRDFVNQTPNGDIDGYLVSVIKKVNRLLYSTYRKKDDNFRLSYVLRYITDVSILEDFDAFVEECLRFVYTGRYSKSNHRIVTPYMLRSWGYVTTVKLYHTAKIAGSVLDFRINKLLHNNLILFKVLPHAEPYQPSKVKILHDCSLFDLLFDKAERRDLYCKGLRFSYNDLKVDFFKKEISLGYEKIAIGNTILNNSKIGYIDDDGTLVRLADDSVVVTEDRSTESVLLKLYRNTFIKAPETNWLIKHNPYKYFRQIDRSEFFQAGNNLNIKYCDFNLFALSFYGFCLMRTYSKEHTIVGDRDNVQLVFDSTLTQYKGKRIRKEVVCNQ